MRRVGDDFEDEYPGADALATECFVNLLHAGKMLMELHNRQSREQYQLSPNAREILAVVEGAGQPLEPSVIAARVLITAATTTAILDTLEKRGLIRRLRHPGDRRRLLVAITPAARAILDELLPSLHACEREVISSALSSPEQHELLHLIAKLQYAAAVLEAQKAPARPAAARQRSSLPGGDAPAMTGTRE